MQSFTCKKCSRSSAFKPPIEDLSAGGDRVVTCEHCRSRNRLIQLPTPQGAPAQFEVAGIID
jgi:DNA-directed RNA polymerase subunit RPC12/RpoP